MFFGLLFIAGVMLGTLILGGLILLPYGWAVALVGVVCLFVAYRIFDEGVK